MKGAKKAVRVKKPVLNEKIQDAFFHFLEYHPPKRFSKNLRRLLIEFLTHEGSTESIYLHETLIDPGRPL